MQILESSAMEPGGTVESPGDLAVIFGAHEATDSSPINGKLALRIASPANSFPQRFKLFPFLNPCCICLKPKKYKRNHTISTYFECKKILHSNIQIEVLVIH